MNLESSCLTYPSTSRVISIELLVELIKRNLREAEQLEVHFVLLPALPDKPLTFLGHLPDNNKFLSAGFKTVFCDVVTTAGGSESELQTCKCD